ncbi:phage tail spike protein [Staphylococcus haemolyticus]|uniref:phage tail spike protein n=1 Tax=Staphylococcus haemolyticus TaxID=1283 RepID=UPI001F0B5DDC|nr:phage tail spike protein [Staphylococcus haemolyticus]MCH4432238.1 phage tail protein [Staphylococcus haemolyticus]
MTETYIRSLYEDIYVDNESVGNGYYTYSGSWVSDDNYYTTNKKRTDYLIGGYLLIQNAVNTTVFMTYWDRLGNFISTQKFDVVNGKHFFTNMPTNANDVSFSFHKSQSDIEINKIGKTYALDAEIKHSQEINGDETIEFDIHYTRNNAVFLQDQPDLNMWLVEFENKEYVIINHTKKGHGDYYMASCTAILYALFKLNTERVYERVDASLTTTEGFNLVFKGTPFTYSVVDNAPSERFEGLGEGASRLEVLKTLIERWGYELKIVGNVFYFYAQIGNDTNFEYRHKINASEIEQSSDASELYTYARGYGNYEDEGTSDNKAEVVDTTDTDKPVIERAKLKREYTSPLAKILGKLHAPPIMDGRIKLKDTMDKKLKELVDSSVVLSFTAKIADMHDKGYDYQNAELGDRVFLVDERINTDREIRVIKIDRDLDANGKLIGMEITFGTSNLTEKYEAKFNTAIKDITDVMNGSKALPFQALDVVAQSMVNKINATTSEVIYDTNGQHFVEKGNKNHLMTLNSSGLLLSTDGGRTAKTAITSEGIVADTITTGSLLTSLVNIVGRNALMYMDGDQFIAKSNIDKRKTVISPNGITITRPDGAAWVENGMFKSAMDIQMAMPQPLASGVSIYGSYYVTSNTSKSYVEEYFFQHKARYLHILGRGKMNNKTSTTYKGMVYVEDPGGSGVLGSQVVSKNQEVGEDPGELIDITIDLGVPTYGYKHFYIYIKSSSGNSEIYFRRSLVELKD